MLSASEQGSLLACPNFFVFCITKRAYNGPIYAIKIKTLGIASLVTFSLHMFSLPVLYLYRTLKNIK
jgi:hypothetical protein